MQADSDDREPQVAAKEDLIYEQRSNEFRSLNTFFWQIPLIMMTLNGGLWFSVATLEVDPLTQRGMLWFAAAANVLMGIALIRLRYIMGEVLSGIRDYEGVTTPKTEGIIVWLFCTVFAMAAIGAALAACAPSDRFLKATNTAKALKVAAAATSPTVTGPGPSNAPTSSVQAPDPSPKVTPSQAPT